MSGRSYQGKHPGGGLRHLTDSCGKLYSDALDWTNTYAETFKEYWIGKYVDITEKAVIASDYSEKKLTKPLKWARKRKRYLALMAGWSAAAALAYAADLDEIAIGATIGGLVDTVGSMVIDGYKEKRDYSKERKQLEEERKQHEQVIRELEKLREDIKRGLKYVNAPSREPGEYGQTRLISGEEFAELLKKKDEERDGGDYSGLKAA